MVCLSLRQAQFSHDVELFLHIADPTIGAWESEANLRALDAMLDAGADPDTKLDAGDRLTALAKAAMVGDTGSVKSLLRHKADPTLRCGADGRGPAPFEIALKYQVVLYRWDLARNPNTHHDRPARCDRSPRSPNLAGEQHDAP